MSKCCLCGVELDDYLEGIWTFEDGQRAHRLCWELPHVKPRERRERAAAFDANARVETAEKNHKRARGV